MLTVEEVAAIPLFSTLPAGELERLARTAADLRLSPGEFAVHEGGEGALYAVLAGKIQVIKTFDGVERTLGWRLPGAISARCRSPWARRFRAAIAPPNRRGCCGSMSSNTMLWPRFRRRS